MVLMLICVIIIAKSIQTPVSQLIQAMGRAENGNFEPVAVRHPDSELGLLEIHYNHLTERLKFLMDSLVQEQKLKRKTELRALQEQMKPHFLYNTLDTIGYIVLTGDTCQAYDAITALGSFYRQSLSRGKQFITLEQELQIIKDYTSLLSLRYEELFTVTYDVDETLYQHEIIKLLLQPLVENSVYHGIKPLGEPGIIIISVKRQNELICLTVSDNGVGMDENLLQSLRSSSPSPRDSFGLAGTIERVHISYPEKGAVELHSQKGKGTSVTIKIPFRRTDKMYQPQPIKMMIVDDEDKMRGLLKICIPWNELDYVITDDVSSANQALELIAERKPDVIITDIEMPFINGLDFAEMVLEEYPHIKIIILTAHDEFDYAKQGLEIGISSFLLKPIKREELIRTVTEIRNSIREEQKKLYQHELLQKS